MFVQQRKNIQRSDHITSIGISARVVRMVARQFIHYATAPCNTSVCIYACSTAACITSSPENIVPIRVSQVFKT